MKNIKSKALTSVLLSAVTVLATVVTANAAQVLTKGTDLKSDDGTVTTNAAGENILTTKKGSYLLTEDSVIYSSKSFKLQLNNTVPAKVDSVVVAKDFEVTGSGELDADSDGAIGIQVGNHFKVFKNTKNGVGTVKATGTKTGAWVYNEIQSEGGTLEATGDEYGIWCYNDIKPYYSSTITATSEYGFGIWAYRDIYAWKGATVLGKGKVAGAYTQIAHIQAEDNGSSITGISTDINSQYAALNAQKPEHPLRAYDNAKVIEKYENPDFVIPLNGPGVSGVNVVSYPSIAKNMKYMNNYTWSSDPTGVSNIRNGLVVESGSEYSNLGLVMGVRTETNKVKNKSVNKDENSELKAGGSHFVIFGDAESDNNEGFGS